MAGAVLCVPGVCVRSEEIELQCMRFERCAWGRGVTCMGRDVAGNAGVLCVGYIYTYMCKGGWFVGLEVPVCMGRCGALVLEWGCTCTVLCGVRDVCAEG